jgi:DnaK suppressor protein
MEKHVMRNRDMKTLDSALRRRARELARSLAGCNEIVVERSADEFDATVLAAERESSARTLAQKFHLLRQIEAARNRIIHGSYGICLSCDGEIGVKRLQAIPWAEYCLSCQAEAEKDGARGRELLHAA